MNTIFWLMLATVGVLDTVIFQHHKPVGLRVGVAVALMIVGVGLSFIAGKIISQGSFLGLSDLKNFFIFWLIVSWIVILLPIFWRKNTL